MPNFTDDPCVDTDMQKSTDGLCVDTDMQSRCVDTDMQKSADDPYADIETPKHTSSHCVGTDMQKSADKPCTDTETPKPTGSRCADIETPKHTDSRCVGTDMQKSADKPCTDTETPKPTGSRCVDTDMQKSTDKPYADTETPKHTGSRCVDTDMQKSTDDPYADTETPNFTDSQRLGIETPTRDILVSAGAGSGKTTVLAERILRKIEQGASFSDFLAVTFTNEAANDLKEKLSQRLERLSAKNPENRAYRRLSYLLPDADICTIDSFCLKHVRENAAALGLTEGCAVGDEALCESLLETAADEVLTRLCEEDDETADLLLDNFASCKSDRQLIVAVRELYKKLRAYPFYMSWFEGVLKRHAGEKRTLEEKGFFACEAGAQIREDYLRTLSAAKEEVQTLYTLCENEVQTKFCGKMEGFVKDMQSALQHSYDSFCAAVKLLYLKRPGKCPEDFVWVYDICRMRLYLLRNYVRPTEQLKLEYEREDKVLKALYIFTSRLDLAYAAAKRERGVLDFADAEHMMLGLLVTPTADGCVKTGLCRRISSQYKEVFVDEYQDVNPLQDAVFEAIGGGKRFMVGDVKQSIYGFRNAYPDIFSGYRNSFAPAGVGAPTAAIFLKENFRCGKRIVRFCNLLFDAVFTEEIAGTDYKKERLIYGDKEKSDFPVRLLVLENADMQAEAERVAAEVARLVGEGVNPSDIALLTRDRKQMQVFAEALKKRDVAGFAPKIKRPLLKEPEVLLVLSLLRVIDNPTDDIALAALLRSPVFRFTADELRRIRRSRNSLYADLLSAAKTDLRFVKARFRLRATGKSAPAPPETRKPSLIKRTAPPLAKKCARFAEKLSLYRAKALLLPSRELLWFLYEDTHLLYFAPEGRETQYRNNLFALLDLAQSAERGVYKGVGAFTDYISRLEESGSSPDTPTPPDENAVRLMTVHGAKGLEFKVVFVCGCGKNMASLSKDKGAVTANFRTGISVKLANQKEAWSKDPLLRKIVLKAEFRRNLAEEYRLFYVAFTRAKERLYISAALKCSLADMLRQAAAKLTTYADLFLPALAEKSDDSYVISVTNAAKPAEGEAAKPAEGEAVKPAEGEAAETKTEAKAELPDLPKLPDLPELRELPSPETVTAKYSVSKLTRLENGLLGASTKELVAFKVPAFASEDGEKAGEAQGALRGTANHKFLQFANFASAEKDTAAEAARLQRDGFLAEEETALLDIPALGRFFASELYGEIRAAKRVYREKRFTTRLPASLFSENTAGENTSGENTSGETVLVQGVIDCFFENADGTYTLIDYKTDRAGERELRARYGVQLWLYALYIEKVTGRKVSRALIYALPQNSAVPCEMPKHYEDVMSAANAANTAKTQPTQPA